MEGHRVKVGTNAAKSGIFGSHTFHSETVFLAFHGPHGLSKISVLYSFTSRQYFGVIRNRFTISLIVRLLPLTVLLLELVTLES